MRSFFLHYGGSSHADSTRLILSLLFQALSSPRWRQYATPRAKVSRSGCSSQMTSLCHDCSRITRWYQQSWIWVYIVMLQREVLLWWPKCNLTGPGSKSLPGVHTYTHTHLSLNRQSRGYMQSWILVHIVMLQSVVLLWSPECILTGLWSKSSVSARHSGIWKKKNRNFGWGTSTKDSPSCPAPGRRT